MSFAEVYSVVRLYTVRRTVRETYQVFKKLKNTHGRRRSTAGRLAVREVQYGSTRFFGGWTVNADRISHLPEKNTV